MEVLDYAVCANLCKYVLVLDFDSLKGYRTVLTRSPLKKRRKHKMCQKNTRGSGFKQSVVVVRVSGKQEVNKEVRNENMAIQRDIMHIIYISSTIALV